MRNKHFTKLKTKYDNFQNHLLRNGVLLAKDTKIGYWGVTPLQETYELFKLLNIGSYGSFLDIGSGDGRIVLLASLFGVESHGIEFDDWLVNSSILIKNSLKLPNQQIKLLQENFMDHDFSKYGLIFISPDKPLARKGLERKMLNELKGHLVVHGWEFQPTMLKKREEHIINGEKFCVYQKS